MGEKARGVPYRYAVAHSQSYMQNVFPSNRVLIQVAPIFATFFVLFAIAFSGVASFKSTRLNANIRLVKRQKVTGCTLKIKNLIC